jgi:hypothetical protein
MGITGVAKYGMGVDVGLPTYVAAGKVKVAIATAVGGGGVGGGVGSLPHAASTRARRASKVSDFITVKRKGVLRKRILSP